jgi:hypothetical protein
MSSISLCARMVADAQGGWQPDWVSGPGRLLPGVEFTTPGRPVVTGSRRPIVRLTAAVPPNGGPRLRGTISVLARVRPPRACLLLAIRASRQMTTEPERTPRSTEAGAIIRCGKSTARGKLAVMETWGIKLRRKPAELGKLLRSVLQ